MASSAFPRLSSVQLEAYLPGLRLFPPRGPSRLKRCAKALIPSQSLPLLTVADAFATLCCIPLYFELLELGMQLPSFQSLTLDFLEKKFFLTSILAPCLISWRFAAVPPSAPSSARSRTLGLGRFDDVNILLHRSILATFDLSASSSVLKHCVSPQPQYRQCAPPSPLPALES